MNSEGETPLDIAEEEAMEELLQNEINRQGTVLHTAICGHNHHSQIPFYIDIYCSVSSDLITHNTAKISLNRCIMYLYVYFYFLFQYLVRLCEDVSSISVQSTLIRSCLNVETVLIKIEGLGALCVCHACMSLLSNRI